MPNLGSYAGCRSLVVCLGTVLLAAATMAGAAANTRSANRAAESAAAPVIQKVEPPNWWSDLTPEVMVMLTGQNLQGARVACKPAAASVERTKVSEPGTHLFVWLNLKGVRAADGGISCRVTTDRGPAAFRLPLAQRPSSSGRYQGFSRDDVVYLIMPDRFAQGDPTNCQRAGGCDRSKARAYHGGDFRGIREHLDYLKELGVTAIWMTPIVQNDPDSPQDYHGYGAVDEYAPERHFGSLADLQALVAAAHAKGMRVILDFVPNHVGPRNPWADDPPEPDWLHGTKANHLTATGDFQYLVDPHAPPEFWRPVVEGWFAGILPDLNQENPDVAEYFTQNALWWAEETGVDGYRLDTFPYVSRKFWSSWHAALKRAYPQMTTVGEVFNRDPYLTSFFVGGKKESDGIDSGVTTVFDYPMFFALREAAMGGPASGLTDVLAQDRLFPHPDRLMTFVGNHDVGRLASLRGMSPAQVKLAFSMMLMLRGIPQLYYGDEIAMTGGDDPDNRRDFPGGFSGDERDAFAAAGRTPEQEEIFTHVQKLLHLRQAHSALRNGQLWEIPEFEASESKSWADAHCYSFARMNKEEKLLVVINTDAHAHDVRLALEDTPVADAAGLTPLLEGRKERIREGQATLQIPAHELRIYSIQ